MISFNDKVVLICFMNTIAKPHVKRLSVANHFLLLRRFFVRALLLMPNVPEKVGYVRYSAIQQV